MEHSLSDKDISDKIKGIKDKVDTMKFIGLMSVCACGAKLTNPISFFSQKAKLEAVTPMISYMIKGLANTHNLSISQEEINEYARGFLSGVGPYKLLQKVVSHSFGLMGGFVINNPAVKMMGGDAILYYYFGYTLDLTMSSMSQHDSVEKLFLHHSNTMKSIIPQIDL